MIVLMMVMMTVIMMCFKAGVQRGGADQQGIHAGRDLCGARVAL